MARFKQNQKPLRRDAYGRTVSFYTSNGIFIAAKWPDPPSAKWKKRNKTKADGFKQVQEFFKYLPPWEHDVYVSMSEGGPFLPRDFWTMNTYQRFLAIERFDGSLMVPQRAQHDVSESLDSLGTTIGGVLIRESDYWRSIDPGPAGTVLQSNGPGASPSWATAAGGGGGRPYDNPPEVSDFTIDKNDQAGFVTDGENPGIVITRQDSPSRTADGYTCLSQPIQSGNQTFEISRNEYSSTTSRTITGVFLYDSVSGEGCMGWIWGLYGRYSPRTGLRENVTYPLAIDPYTSGHWKAFGNADPYFKLVINGKWVEMWVAIDASSWVYYGRDEPTVHPSNYDRVAIACFMEFAGDRHQQVRITHWQQRP